jgi:hypothetical protein
MFQINNENEIRMILMILIIKNVNKCRNKWMVKWYILMISNHYWMWWWRFDLYNDVYRLMNKKYIIIVFIKL